METLIYTLLLILFAWFMIEVTDYPERMKEYNANGCAVYGYEPDCKTKLGGD